METLATTLPNHVAREVDSLVASGLYVSRSEVLRTALRELVRRERASPLSRRSSRALETRVRRLAGDARWRNRYVALYRGEPIDSDADQDALVRRVLGRREDPVYIVFAGKAGQTPRE